MSIPRGMYIIRKLSAAGFSDEKIISYIGCSRRSFYRWKKGKAKPNLKYREVFSHLYSKFGTYFSEL